MVSSHWITRDFAVQRLDVTWPHGYAVAGQEPRSRNSALLSDSTARTAHANLVRRAEKRSKESATWQPAARKIETALGLNTEHKARPRRSPLLPGSVGGETEFAKDLPGDDSRHPVADAPTSRISLAARCPDSMAPFIQARYFEVCSPAKWTSPSGTRARSTYPDWPSPV